MTRRRPPVIAIALVTIAAVATVATAAGPGVAFTAASSVAIQSDGKIVVAGSLQYKDVAFAVARYGSGGDLDAGFGTGGSVSTDIPASAAYGAANAVAIADDGKIVAAGSAWNGITYDFVVVRYEADGILDAGFAGAGFVQTDLGLVHDESATDVAIQTDGKILIAGVSGSQPYLLRYTTAGALDADFGTGGILALPVTLSGYQSPQIELQSDGRILVLAVTNASADNVQIMRLEADGQPETTFGGDGIASTTASSGQGAAFALQDDEKIVLVLSDGVLIRFGTNGELDASFDGDGVVFPTPLEWIDSTAGVLAQDGKITVVGFDEQHVPSSVLARFDSTGALDASFGSGGLADLPSADGYYYDDIIQMARQPDGHIVLVGRTEAFPWSDFVMRLDAAGAPDTAFGEAGTIYETQCRNVPLDSPSCIDSNLAKARFCQKQPYWWYTLHIATWKWRGNQPSPGPVASGADSTYTICVYDMHGGVPVLVRPVDGSWDHWSPTSTGWKLQDEDQYYWGALTELKVSAPAAPRLPTASAQLHAAFSMFDGESFFDADPGIVVQLVNSDGLCWKSTFSGSEIVQNDARCFKGKK